ncbi:MAG: hypothetical protein K8L91_17720 [Anaerolineae bacterium]|nr:hypothetical protein [Anaerolineae bacterium]
MLRSLVLMLVGLSSITTLTPVTPNDPHSRPAATPPILEFVEYQRLDEVGDTQYMTISPDGSTLVWPDDASLCSYQIATATTACIATNSSLRGMTDFTWSPDSRYLAFHENLFRFMESDLWVFDFETQQLVNLTEDNLQGDFISDDMDPANLDYFSVWGPENTLYFVRIFWDNASSSARPISLQRIVLTDGLAKVGTPELVSDLTSWMQGDGSALYSSRWDVLGGSVVLSPDGQFIAFALNPADPSLVQSILILDTASGDIRQITTLSELLQSGVPSWYQGDFWQFKGLGWSGDGQYLVVATSSPQYTAAAEPVYAIHVDTAEVMTLIDFSGVPDETSFTQPSTADEVTGLYDVMRAGVVTPDGSYVVYFNVNTPDFGVSALPLLPPNESNMPLRLFRFSSEEYGEGMTMVQSSVGDDGAYVRVLLFGYMFTFAKR